MLIVTLQNVERNEDNTIADYDYVVRVNHKVIASGSFKGFERSKGWQNLVLEMLIEEKTKGYDVGV